jgi:rhodanese-related sulfurtransferase
MKNLDKLPPKDRPLVLICGSGHRSALGMEALGLLGYVNTKSLVGGIRAWKAAGLPLAAGDLPAAKRGAPPDVDPRLLGLLDQYLSNLPADWNTIAPSALKDLIALSKPFQLELRDPKEVAESGFIPGSVDIPIRTLIRSLDRLPPDKSALIVAECGSGHRSALAMLALNLLGYSNVRVLECNV